MATVTDLFDIAQAFLDVSLEALQQTELGPPARYFVSPGEPAMDCCGQLAVWNSEVQEIDFNAGQGARAPSKRVGRGGQFDMTVNIQITRCGPTVNGRGDFPDPADLTLAARYVNEDVWAIWLGVSWSLKHGILQEVCSGALRLPAAALAQQGQCIGWTLGYRYPLEGGRLGT